MYVIGIGASAGGLEAIRTVLAHLDQGLEQAAMILAQHLSPDHISNLTDILSKQQRIRVREAAHDQVLEANTVFVTPQACEITVRGDRIQLTRPATETGSSPSIDVLFRSLAEEKRDLAVGVILSGFGYDGAAGLCAIHRAGGLTLAQEPASAQTAGMPEAAIATGCVDRILAPEQIGAALSALALMRGEADADADATKSDVRELHKVLQRLSEYSGTDFSNYKLPTLRRRFHKRLTQLELLDATAYLAWLDTHPDEPEELFKLMLIGVTQFFRDPQAFVALEAHLTQLLAAKAPDEPFRIWIPGCATGEEAYTLTFIVHRLLQARGQDCQLQVFASDLDEPALAFARKGVYSAADVEGLPEALLGDCFVRLGEGFQVKQELRARILFARHDVASNPPFLKLDLISCRNLMIYFTLPLQKQLLPIFHYALNPNAYLFLGRSESIGEFIDLFETLDAEHKIYKRKQGSPLRAIHFSAFKPQRSLHTEPAQAPLPGALSLGTLVKETLFASFEYPYAVIDDALEVQEICGDARLYLGVGQGQLTTHILRLIQSELQLELMAVITQAQRERALHRSPICRFSFLGQTYYVRFCVKPLLFTAKDHDLYLVIFEPIDPREWLPPAEPAGPGRETAGSEVPRLRHELETVRLQLQNYIEELEASNEELQILNEELLSTNEEFQSSNEELVTSSEELQSTYEEVQAAYAQLQVTNHALEASQQELRRAEANVWALLNNTLQAFVFVDSRGQIITFNQEASLLCHRLRGKTLAPGLDFQSCFQAEDQAWFAGEFRLALEGKFCAGEQRLQAHHTGPVWLAYNFTPVLAPDQSLQGVSISFLDSSERILAQLRLRAQDQHFKALIENSFDGIAICDKYGLYSYLSPSTERLLGYAPKEMLYHHSSEFIHPEDLGKMGRILSGQDPGAEPAYELQWRQRRKDGSWRWLEGVGINRFDLPEISGTIINFRDVTERRQQQDALRLSEIRLRQIIDLLPAYIYARDSQNRLVLVNAMTARLFRTSAQELEGRSLDALESKLPENQESLQADREVREQSVIRILPEIRFDAGSGPVQLLRSFKIPYTASDSGHPATLTLAMDQTAFRQSSVPEVRPEPESRAVKEG